MKRKQLDVHGKIVEVDEVPALPTSPVVGSIGAPPTAEPSLGLWSELLLQLAALHIVVARLVRKLLLVDIDSHEANQLREAVRTLALQVNGEAKMIAEVRVRLRWHERQVPLLRQSRRRFDAQMAIRDKEKAASTPPTQE